MYGIKIIDSPILGVSGQWIESFDWDAHAPGKLYPTGNGSSTDDPAKAMRFDTVEAAWEAWRRPSAVCPTRPDGKPNRPMTVFTISVEKLPEEGGGDEGPQGGIPTGALEYPLAGRVTPGGTKRLPEEGR